MQTPVWSTSVPDWEQRIVTKQSMIPFQPLFPDHARRALDVMGELILVDVAGSPTVKDSMREWFMDFAGAIFGAYDEVSGRRLIQEFFLLISKKNAKSTGAAAIMLTALILNWRLSGEYIIIAPTVEVAQNAFKPIHDMINADDRLKDLFQVSAHVRTVTHRTTNATLKVVAADSSTVSGKKAIGILIDELWEFGRNPNADNMIMEATGGLASRPEGFVIYLSTQSDKPPAGVFRSKLQYARKVRDGEVIDNGFLPVLYEHPRYLVANKQHLKLENFYMTNPNLGLSVDEDFLRRRYAASKEEGPDKFFSFLAKHGNIEIGLALGSDRWAGAEYWEASEDPHIDLDWIIAKCEVVCVGIDGGGLDDLLGLSVVGRIKDSSSWVSWSKAWAHLSVLERRKAESPRLLDFRDSGQLTVVKVMGEDVDEVASIVSQIEKAELLYQVGIDPAGIGAILDGLEAAEIPGDKIVGVAQNWKLGGAIKTAERKLAQPGALRHAAQPLMNWCVGNAKVESRSNSILITKQASGSAKIDPLMAFFNAITLISTNPPAQVKKYQMFVLG